jgi:glycosyltransferase involved in cell wall biosynthesis
MSESIFFSVVIAVYNGEKFLTETIKSILAQSYQNFELLVVDDRSTDQTVNIVKRWIELDARIRLISNANSSGPSEARNYGVSQAIGTWIAICDADDLWYPEKLRSQADLIHNWQDEEPIVALGTSGNTINEAGKVLGLFSASPRTLEEFATFRASGEPFLGFLHSSMVFKKDLFSQIGGYREDYVGAEDADLFTRLTDLGITLNIDRTLTSYRKHLGSWQLDNTLKQANNVERMKANTYRRRNHMNELTYEEFVTQSEQKMTDGEKKAFLRKSKGKYLYRIGAINLANGRYFSGLQHLLLALPYDRPLVVSSLKNILQFKVANLFGSLKKFVKPRF